MVCERVWLKKDMTLRKPDGRGRGVTVVGAISEKQGLIHYSILQESNNTNTFSTFLKATTCNNAHKTNRCLSPQFSQIEAKRCIT